MRYRPPSLYQTGHGYQYFRCECGPADDTLYLHQLAAIADGADPYEVFGDKTDIHHKPLSDWLDLDQHVPPAPLEVGDLLVPAIDVPHGVEPQSRWDHRSANLRGEADD